MKKKLIGIIGIVFSSLSIYWGMQMVFKKMGAGLTRQAEENKTQMIKALKEAQQKDALRAKQAK